jgi:integrase
MAALGAASTSSALATASPIETGSELSRHNPIGSLLWGENGPLPAIDRAHRQLPSHAAAASASGGVGRLSAVSLSAERKTRQRTFREAAEAFLARRDLAPSSTRGYRGVLERLVAERGDCPGWPTASELEAAAVNLWGDLAPATWNRNTAIVRSFLGWAQRHYGVELEPPLERRRVPADRSRAIPYAELERLWRQEDVPLREKALWRLLYETAARASEILGLNVEDIDISAKRARVRSKGGDIELVHFQSGSARLLPRLVAGRRSGPLFLTDRAAPPGTPALDVCPSTGRARLSYRRAAALFTDHSGFTLHQLRHAAITHLAERGVPTTLLMAKSRLRSLRTLQRYARPGVEAVAQLTAEHDPNRRAA